MLDQQESSEEHVYSKLQRFIFLSIAMVLMVASGPAVRAESPAPADSATATVRGHITDPTGALIPGAKVVITNSAGGTVATILADSAGAYAVNNLAPGSYFVQATYDGFAPFQSQAIPLTAGQIKHVHIVMAIEVAQQSVVVTDEDDAPQVSVEAGANANSVVLKGKDLDALSDDPDELSNELSALAGPSAGPNGGQIYIDGFSGGQLPPKSAIREIRINQNPFSAEFDRLGYGRIEILTKPGTDKLHGQFFLMGNDKPFNTSNPFTTTVPEYYSYQFNGTLNGSLNKTTSFFLSAERRDQQNVNAWRIYDAVMPNSSGVYTDYTDYGVSLLSPHERTNVSARIDWQWGAKQTFTARYGFWSESEHGNLSTGSLASASTHESNTDHTIQASDSIVINDHAVNEIRFQYERQNENHYPDSPDRTVSVTGDFSGGGYSGQKSLDHATRLELWDITTLSHNAHAIKFGTRMRDTRDANLTNANFNGAFTFQSAAQYEAMANGLAANNPSHTYESFETEVNDNNGPTSASYTTGNESALANVFDVALFAQDDWKVNPRLTLSGGIRWEAQNHLSDHDDWAPRVSLAYALDGNGKDKKAKTVLRAGYGFFYDRLGSGNLLTVNRANVQKRYIFNNPTCPSTANSSATSCLYATSLGVDDTNPQGVLDISTLSGASLPVQYEVAPHYQSPVTEQLGASLERQILPGSTLTLTYLNSHGVHQSVTRNANQDFDANAANTQKLYIYQYFPEAIFKENQLITSINAKFTKNFSLMGSYTYASANSNANGSASNADRLNQDYGRAGFVARNQLFLMGSYTAPWGIRFNPFLVAQSGRPFNITLSSPDTLNAFGNQRPYSGTAAECAAGGQYVTTSLGCFYTGSTPATDDALIPVNMGNGPAAVAFNLRISRGFGIGPKLASANNGQNSGGGPPDGGGHGGRGGPPGGGLGPGGLGSSGGRGPGGMMGGASTGRKYNLNFSVQALNLFNDIDYGQPGGSVGSPSFNHSTSLAGGIFSTGSAARRVFAQVNFSF